MVMVMVFRARAVAATAGVMRLVRRVPAACFSPLPRSDAAYLTIRPRRLPADRFQGGGECALGVGERARRPGGRWLGLVERGQGRPDDMNGVP